MAKEKNKQLLVEGNDDLHVISALCEKYKVPETFSIIDCKGISFLIESIPVRLKQSDINTLGIIVDADSDLNRRWEVIKQKLIDQGYTSVPVEMPSAGLVLKEEDKISIGVWLMPDNNAKGMLEDFIKFLIPDEDTLLPIVESSLDRIENERLNRYKEIHKSKAIIHTWLAWQEDPGTPMGLSITKKYLDADVEECTLFIDWLKKLFKE